MIHDHIRNLLSRFQYRKQLKETAVFRILFIQKMTTYFQDRTTVNIFPDDTFCQAC